MKTKAQSGKQSLSVELVQLEAIHLPRVMEIENRCFSQPWSKEDFLRLLDKPDSVCLVALAEGRVIGYSCCWIMIESAELGNLAVDPDYQCRSVGSKLLKETIKVYRRRKVAAIFLEVRTSNRKAIELYEFFGFSKIGLRREYYTQPVEDALIMKLDLG